MGLQASNGFQESRLRRTSFVRLRKVPHFLKQRFEMERTAVVANTDRAWFDHFRPADALTMVDEVTFWRPLAQHRFRALEIGEPLFFRLKQPNSAVAGFGFFAGQYALTIAMAWETFGTKNGDPTYERFVARIESYRRRLSTPGNAGGVHVSCLVLRDSMFLPESQWPQWRADDDWSANIVSYKSHD